jgi:hypothetical protein
MKNNFYDFKELEALTKHPVSGQIDEVFKSVIKSKSKRQDQVVQEASKPAAQTAASDEMEIDELEIDLGGSDGPPEVSTLDEGMDLSFSEEETLDLGDSTFNEESSDSSDNYGDLSFDGGEEDGLSLGETEEATPMENLGELDFSNDTPDLPSEVGLSLSDDDSEALSLSDDEPSEDLSLGEDDGMALSLGDKDLSASLSQTDLSEDAKEKLKEIDALMDNDASHIDLSASSLNENENLDQPLVSDDLDLGSLDFGIEESEESEEKVVTLPKEEKTKKKKKEVVQETE